MGVVGVALIGMAISVRKVGQDVEMQQLTLRGLKDAHAFVLTGLWMLCV